MKAELEEALYTKYPKLFRQKDLSMQQTCMCWGCSCGDGWYQILENLCSDIQKHLQANPEVTMEFSQIKEKYGGLRIYIDGGDDHIDGLIDMAEAISYKTCEECGSEQGSIRNRGWMKTLCDNCFNS